MKLKLRIKTLFLLGFLLNIQVIGETKTGRIEQMGNGLVDNFYGIGIRLKGDSVETFFNRRVGKWDGYV